MNKAKKYAKMNKSNIFPECFSEAPYKLRKRFCRIESAIIDDGIQYAKIEYWIQGIVIKIPNEHEALGWLLTVARNYLLKEVKYSKRYAKLSEAIIRPSSNNCDARCVSSDFLCVLEKKYSKESIAILTDHVLGYSLKELAGTSNISEDAMRQRHARITRTVRTEMTQYYRQ